MKQRKPNDHNKRLHNFIKSNLAKHVVVFTASCDNPRYVNKFNPGARTCVSRETMAAFDPESNIYGMFRYTWDVYPVIVTKDTFGKKIKTRIIDPEDSVQNANWLQVSQFAIDEIDKELCEIPYKFRLNFGALFVLAGTKLTDEQVISYMKQDPEFYEIDESRDLRTKQEYKEDNLRLIEALEVV